MPALLTRSFVWILVVMCVLAQAAAGAPLTWNDLVNHPERWPITVNVLKDLEFQSGKRISKSAPLRVLEVNGQGATLLSADGMIFGAGPKDCNLVAAANTYMNSLTPEQRALTLAAIAADETLVPEKVTVIVPLDFGTETFALGTEVNVTKVSPQWLTIGHGSVVTDLSPGQTDIYTRARELVALPKAQRPVQKYLDSLTPAQRALTVEAIQADKSIIPLKVTLKAPVTYQQFKAPVGAEVQVHGIKGRDVSVVVQGEAIVADASVTDILKRARELLALPKEQRPDRMQPLFAGKSLSADGKPLAVKPADHYLLYFASSTCPRCESYTPRLVSRVAKTLAGKNVSVVSVANQERADALAYASKTNTPWPIVPWDNRAVPLNEYHVRLQPGLVLVDKFGNTVSTNSPGHADMATVDTAINSLDSILAQAPSRSPTSPAAAPSAAQQADGKKPPPLFYAVTYTPGEKWVKGKHLLQQPGITEQGAYWNDRTNTGELVTMGLLDDGMGGAMSLVQGESLESVKALVNADPAVKSGLLKAEVRSWRALAWMGETNLPAAAETYRAKKK
jgi:Thioredoxin-like